MERCHICNAPVMDTNTGVILEGRDYPLCPLHGTQMADYLVTMLQGWLHDSQRKEKHG